MGWNKSSEPTTLNFGEPRLKFMAASVIGWTEIPGAKYPQREFRYGSEGHSLGPFLPELDAKALYLELKVIINSQLRSVQELLGHNL